MTKKYCYTDWVLARKKKDSDGSEMKAFYYYVLVPALTDVVPTPNRRHWADTTNQYNSKSWQGKSSPGLGSLYFKGHT